MVHRNGLVEARDANGENALVVRWVAWPDDVLTLESLGRVTKEKRFPIGDTLHFNTQEFAEICSTLLKVIDDVVERLRTWQRSASNGGEQGS